jgi:hypothetical protein
MASAGRIAKRRRWDNAVPVLCGKRSADGHFHCAGVLGLVSFAFERGRPSIQMSGHRLLNGVWRPQLPRLSTLREQRVIRHQLKQLARIEGADLKHQGTLDFYPEMQMPLVECPRCHEVQRLLSDSDVKVLASVIKSPIP